MDGKGISRSIMVFSEEKNENLYPKFFGVSCAFFALRILSEPKLSSEQWSDIKNGMLQGSAYLLGLFVWRAQKDEAGNDKSELRQKLENAQGEIEELKNRRREDAKANEKVVGIFAAQEQGWFNERKKLRQQIGGLMNELRISETNKDKALSDLKGKLQDNELLLKSKDKILKEEEQKRQDLEEKLKNAESTIAEFREAAKQENQRHSNEISKHKTACIELVSNQRQLEAEMGRALRQIESLKQDRDIILEQKEQSLLMTQKLSLELVKMRRDMEQKDQILSAMLRKSKLDTTEKQMLLEEVTLSKAKRKQAELKTERLKTDSEPRRDRYSLRSMLSKHANTKADAVSGRKGVHSNAMMASNMERPTTHQMNYLVEYEQPGFREGIEAFSPLSDRYLSEGIQDTTDFHQLEGWVRSQAEKYRTAIDQRHQLEIDAFAEQLRVKDEKLEAFRWRLLSMELESKRLQSIIEGLDNDLSQLKQANMKLEVVLLNREAELQSLKEKLALRMENHPNSQRISSNAYPHDLTLAYDTIWSKVKIVKRRPGEDVQESKTTAERNYQPAEEEKQEKSSANYPSKDIVLTLQPPQVELEEELGDAIDQDSIQEQSSSSQGAEKAEASQSAVKCLTNKINSSWKMDLHALGVSYKIRRLKQQLLMLERLTGKRECHESSDSSNNGQINKNVFCALMSLLNKQVGRYQSLQGKTDDLCQRMHENSLYVRGGDLNTAKTREEIRLLEQHLEETFHLQRYMVATGQKLMELQAKIASGFLSAVEEFETPASFDMKRFADNIKTLFREVQRGLEIRISRIIGDLEGTLACDGIIHFKK
ncbi:uncharacterized protein [Coffea arabica]|uniref:Myosin-7B n=1 Tax=Coffea arabica TaxID=13443 RepID=A0A6P6W6A8_COFAR|nr:myosin-7B [Coffea arabica]XP_027110056.1 myosin-7B [Coffea arabica]